MKKNIAPLLFGILLILGGLGYIGSIIFDWNFSLFFDGWWTLFIIVPTFVSILANGPHPGNLVGMLIGVLLLLRCQSLLSSHYLAVAIVATVVIAAGISLLISYFRKNPKNGGYYGDYYPNDAQQFDYQAANPAANQASNPAANATTDGANTYTYTASNGGTDGTGNANGTADGNNANNQQYNYQYNYQYTYSDNNGKRWTNDVTDCPDYNAILSGSDVRNVSQNFGGAHVCAILGGMNLDLRDCIVTQDITIYVTAVMGGVDIYAPKNVRISLSKTDILGGTDCKAYSLPINANAPLCTFVTTAILGGVDIK